MDQRQGRTNAVANEGGKTGKQDLDAVVGHGDGGLVLPRPPAPYLALQLVLELLHGGALAVHQHDVVRQHGADEAAGGDTGGWGGEEVGG